MIIGNTISIGNPSNGGSGGPTPQDFFVATTGSGSGIGSEGDPFTGAQLQTLIDAGLLDVPPGSTIKFNKGDTFPYQYDLNNGDVYFGSYGSGDDPLIYGGTDISGLTWTYTGANNIYYCTLATEPRGVFVSDRQVPMAESDWIIITGRPSDTTLTAAQATLQAQNSAQALVGSYLVAKEWEFRPCIRVTITAYNGTTQITMDQKPNQTDVTGAGTNNPFKLLNRLVDITTVGEWAHDSSAQRLYIKTAGGAPTNIVISERDYGFKLSAGVSNVSFTGLKFQHQFLEGIWGTANDNITVDGCAFTDIITNASSFTGDGSNLTFINNTIQYVSNNGLHVGGIDGGLVDNNVFSHIGDQVGVSVPIYSYFKSVGVSVHFRWDDTATVYVPRNFTVTNNDSSDNGYVGYVVLGMNHLFQYNRQNRFNLKWSDGGGIYVSNVYGPIYGGGSDTTNCQVLDNIILNGNDTTRTREGYVGGGNGQINGIQCDRHNSNIIIARNFIHNMTSSGIRINPENDTFTIEDNKVVNAGVAGFYFFNGTESGANDHTFTDNLFVAGGSGQYAINLEHTNGTYNPFSGGSCNNNRYINLYASGTQQMKTDFNGVVTNYTFAGWQALYGHDAASTVDVGIRHLLDSGDTVKAALDSLVQTNWGSESNTTLNTDSDNYYLDETGTHVTSATVTPYSGRVLIRDWPPQGSIVFDDTYTGSSGNITGHTPDVGSAWTIDAGVINLNGSGEITAGTTGSMIQDTGKTSVIMETTGKVSTTAGVIISFRQVSNADKCFARLSINNTASSSTVNVFANATEVDTNGLTMSTNTYYTIKINSKGGTIGVWVDGVLRLDAASNAALAAENPSSTRHGLVIATTGVPTHTRTTIYDTSF